MNNKSKFLINSAYFVVVLALVFIAYKYLLPFLLPFVLAIIIGFAVQKPSLIISKKIKIKTRTLAPLLALCVFIIGLSIVGFLIYFLFANSTDVINWVTEILSTAAEKITVVFGKYSDFSKQLPSEIGIMLENLPNSLAETAIGYLSGFLSTTATFLTKNLPSFLFGFIITIMASIYFARDFSAVKKFAFSIIPNNYHSSILKIKNIMFKDVFKMIKGYCILIFITFSELTVALLLAGIKNAVFLSLIISLIDALPVLGVGAVLIPWAIISILTGNIGFGIYIAVIYIIITVVRNIFEPKILSNNLGIPPLLSILIIFCGLKLFGFFGMLVAFVSLVIFIDYYREAEDF